MYIVRIVYILVCQICFYTGVLTLSYVYIRAKSQNRCDSCTYTYTEFVIDEIWDFNRGLTDILRYHQQKVFMCFRQPLHQHVYQSAEKWSLLEVLRCLSRVLKVTIAGPSSNSSIGMENNDELYGFSAVKVKLVDSLI